MARLLSVRSLSPDSPGVTSPTSHLPLADNPQRCQSTISLVQDGSFRRSPDAEINSFQNPVFQPDDLPAGQNSRRFASGDQPSPEVSEAHTDSLKRSLSPSDSGILIPDDVVSIKSGKSLDSGLDELCAISSEETKIAISSDKDKPPVENGSATGLAKKEDDDEASDKGCCALSFQVFVPFVLAGLGTCGAGLVLDFVESWHVFKEISELFILVPTLLGLKGNLEMTLASRVSTQANLGLFPTFSKKVRMIWGNLALIQCQATLLTALAALFASITSSFNNGFNLERSLLIAASALLTAAVASFVLGFVTLGVVLLATRCNINPDNVATPIAASLGDITTLGILASVADYFHLFQGNIFPSIGCIAILLALLPVWMYLAYRNPYVKDVLFTGWAPVIIAVVITSAGGYILEYSIVQFKGLAVFQPIINGVAGNLVAVQASRISTYLHKYSEPGSRPPDGSSICMSPFRTFFGRNPHSRTALILLSLVLPGHAAFGYLIHFIKSGDTALTPDFLPIYLAAAFIQVTLLLYIAQCLIHFLWRRRMDPDNWAIPLLTALGDLSGMAVLASAFFLHRAVSP